MMPENKHQKIAELLPFYLKEKLNPTELKMVKMVELHLAECRTCQTALQEWQAISENVVTYQQAFQRSLKLPPLVLPNEASKPAQTRKLLTVVRNFSKNFNFLFLKDSEGKATMRYQHENEPLAENYPTSRPYRRIITGGMMAVSLLALLILWAAFVNRPGTNNIETSVGSQVRASVAVPTPLPTIPAATTKAASPATFEGKLKTTINYNFRPEAPGNVAVAASGTALAIAEKGVLKFYNNTNGSLLKTIEVPAEFRSSIIWADLSWSPDGKTLAVAYYYTVAQGAPAGTVEFFTAEGERRFRLEGFNESVLSMHWSPDNKLLAISSSSYNPTTRIQKNNLYFWSSEGKLVRTILQDQPLPIHRVAWSPDSKLLAADLQNGAAVGAGKLQLWETAGKLVAEFPFQEDTIEELTFSPNGKWLAVGRATASDNLRLYNIAQLHKQPEQSWQTLAGHTNFVSEIVWSPDSQKLASFSQDNTVRLWEAVSAKSIATLSTGGQVLPALDWSPDGKLWAVGTNNGQIQVLDSAGKPLKVIPEQGAVYKLDWTAEGQELVSVTEAGTVKTWQR